MLATIISPVVLALVELVKRTLAVPKRYLPVIAVLIGLIVGGLSFPFTELEIAMRLWAGGLAGLSATGLFELGKRHKDESEDQANAG